MSKEERLLSPVRYNIGIFGIGPYTKKDNLKEYTLWCHMLKRCYDPAWLAKHPTYNACTVHPKWLVFQNFCKDIHKMDNACAEGFDLDKDLMIFGNTEYGPKTCSFVPHDIL